MKRWIMLSAAATAAMAGGYKIPENSLNSTALSAAYVANAHGADAAYWNPAAMVRNGDVGMLEIDATYIGLTPIDFAGMSGSYSSRRENFLIPTLHFASKKLGENGARVGMSIVVPAGLSKRWDAQPARGSAEEFTLQTVEFNPSMAIPLGDTLSVGAGFRIVHSSGVVKAQMPGVYAQNMEGDAVDYGYNLALNARPFPELSLAATYRSRIDLGIEGDADLSHTGGVIPGDPLPTFAGNYGASVAIPLPAALNLAAAWTFGTGTTVEAVFERTFWSAYETLDFDFSHPYAEGFFGRPKEKSWENANAYRFGVTQECDRWNVMAAVAYDETPIRESTLGYELPDSDAWVVSVGGRYDLDEHWNIGLAALADLKKSRRIDGATNANGIDGEFSHARAYLITAGAGYRF